MTSAPTKLRVKIIKINQATGNVNTFQFLLKFGPFRRALRRAVNVPQQHSGITQMKSIVTQPVPFNTSRPSNLTQVQTVSRNAGELTPGILEHKKKTTSRKRCFIALSSCGVVRASCKKGHVGIP